MSFSFKRSTRTVIKKITKTTEITKEVSNEFTIEPTFKTLSRMWKIVLWLAPASAVAGGLYYVGLPYATTLIA